MKKIIGLVFVIVFSGLIGINTQAAEMRALIKGTDYEVMSPKGSKTREVLEFFSYACGACYSMESIVGDFKKSNPDIKVIPVPTDLGHAQWEIYVKAYYLGKLLKVIDISHPKVFHMIHVEKKHFLKDEDLKRFFVGLGVEPGQFDKASKSFALNASIRKAKQLLRTYRVSSTPTFIANKKYKLNNKSFESAEMIKKALKELTVVE